MLMIRLQRTGRRNHAEFRVVVTEHTRGPKSSDYLEVVGNYNPHTNAVAVKSDRIQEWIGKGAQVSDTVHNLLVKEKVIEGKKKNVLPKKTPIVKEEAPAAEVPAPATAEAPVAAEEAAPQSDEVPEEAAPATETEEEKQPA